MTGGATRDGATRWGARAAAVGRDRRRTSVAESRSRRTKDGAALPPRRAAARERRGAQGPEVLRPLRPHLHARVSAGARPRHNITRP